MPSSLVLFLGGRFVLRFFWGPSCGRGKTRGFVFGGPNQKKPSQLGYLVKSTKRPRKEERVSAVDVVLLRRVFAGEEGAPRLKQHPHPRPHPRDKNEKRPEKRRWLVVHGSGPPGGREPKHNPGKEGTTGRVRRRRRKNGGVGVVVWALKTKVVVVVVVGRVDDPIRQR